MRRMLMMLAAAILCMTAWARTGGDGQSDRCGTLVFDTLSADVGMIDKDSAAVAVFRFRVTGDTPVAIQRAASSCNCTTVTFAPGPYRPGEEGEIRVRYNSQGMPPGYFRKVVVVRSDASDPLVRLSLSGRVRREKRIKDL